MPSLSRLVTTLKGIDIGFPESEKLEWAAVQDPDKIDPRMISLALAHVDAEGISY